MPNESMSNEGLDALLKIHRATTPGPWVFIGRGPAGHRLIGPAGGPPALTVTPTISDYDLANTRGYLISAREVDNAMFVAHVHELFPALVAEIKRLRAELNRAAR